MNAILERPTICQKVAVCHPVGHAVSRYAMITQPALLLFDRDDDGHPISVGRRMRRVLPNPIWHEFASGAKPNWLEENMPRELVRMLKNPPLPRRQDSKLPVLMRLNGGIQAWQKAHGREFKEYEMDNDSETKGAQLHGEAEKEDLPYVQEEVWKTIVDEVLGVVKYVSPDGKIHDKRPAGVLITCDKWERDRKDGGTGSSGSDIVLFDDDEDALKAQKRKAKEVETEARKKELRQRACSLCEQPLLSDPVPARIHLCRHVFCACCVEETLQFAARKCPVCAKSTGSPLTFFADGQLGAHLSVLGSTYAGVNVERQRARLGELMEARGSTSRIIIRVGNSVEDCSSSRPSQTVHVECVHFKAARGCKKGTFISSSKRQKRVPRSKVIQKVAFNINPSYSKPTLTMSRQMAKKGKFTLSRCLGFEFPCYCTVELDQSLGLPPLEIQYRTSLEEGGDAINVVVDYNNKSRSGNGADASKKRTRWRKKIVVSGEMDSHIKL